MKRSRWFWLALSLLLPASASAQGAPANPYLDLDLEAGDCAGGWYSGSMGYEIQADTQVFQSGHSSLRMRYAAKEPWTEGGGRFGVVSRPFPIEAVAGHKVRFSGAIRTEGVSKGYAGLWWRADGEGKAVAFDNMAGRGATGTTPWTRYQIEIEVPKEAQRVLFGALFPGDGTAWFDDLQIEIDGVRWVQGPPPPTDVPGEAAVAWLREHAIPFSTPEAGHGFADLQPLKKVIGNARIVALGEGTHGTREFFQMKHRLTEFLASEMGFTLFAIEANMPEAYRVNDYVLTGKGDPKELLKGMYFWTWNTQEVLDMIEWMRAFNQSGKGRIQFLGFDMQTATVAAQIARDFLAKAEPDQASLGDAFAQAEKTLRAGQMAPVGMANRAFPNTLGIAGKKVHLSGWIKTRDVTGGQAGLFWGAQGGGGTTRDEMAGRGATGTADWKRFEIELTVHPRAKFANFGARLNGSGTAWIDDLSLEVDGKPWTDPAFDPGFESETSLRDWFTGGLGYEVGLDSEVAHSGQRSLRLTRTSQSPEEAAKAVEEAEKRNLQAVKDALAHLEAGRQGYLARFPKEEVEWAIQNARVVLQAAELGEGGPDARDRSMAKNVEWILEQAPPGAKIVLWAHNGHVSREKGAMGSFLTERFGKDMVVLGFAMGRGTYTAVGEQGLDTHEALPAAPGSVEAYLASAGLPRLIVDLRDTGSSPAAPWLAAERPFRSIGALATRCSFFPATVASQYDGLIWFGETSHSVSLP